MPENIINNIKSTYPTAHHIPDVHLRSFNDDADFELIASITQRSLRADRILRLPTREMIAHGYSSLRNFNPRRDVMLAIQNDKPVAYVRLNWNRDANGRIQLSHQSYTLPRLRQTGVSEELLEYAETRLKPLARGCESVEAAYLSSSAYESEVEKWGLLERAGYQIETTYHDMICDLNHIHPGQAVSADLRVRQAATEDEAFIWNLLCENEADMTDWEAGDYAIWRQNPLHQPALWKVLLHGDDIIGCSLSHINHQENRTLGRRWAYIDRLIIQAEWKTSDTARLLMVQTLNQLRSSGIRHAVNRVERDDPVCGRRCLKELGFHTLKRFSAYRKNLN